MKYRIVLYNRGKRIRTFSRFNLYGDAIREYKRMLDSNKVIFPKLYNFLGQETNYELLLIGPKGGKTIDHVRDSLNRIVHIEPPKNSTIKKISPYAVEDHFKNKFTNKRYTFKTLMSELLSNNDELGFYVFNNKLVIEKIFDESLSLFVLKNKQDTFRLLDTIKKFSVANSLCGFLFFPHSKEKYKKRIRNKLIDEYGLESTYLKKVSTR